MTFIVDPRSEVTHYADIILTPERFLDLTEPTSPDDLAPGVYVDRDDDLWLVDAHGDAVVLTDRLGWAHGLSDLVVGVEAGMIPADEAHAAYRLRLIRPLTTGATE